MTDPLQDLLNRNAIQTNPFSPTSRYARTPMATLKMPDEKIMRHSKSFSIKLTCNLLSLQLHRTSLPYKALSAIGLSSV